MVKRNGKRRWRRALILALFLLVPALLSDLPVFPKTGHGGGVAPANEALTGTLALPPLEPDTLHPGHGHRHWHTATGTGDIAPDNGRDELLRDLVYTHDNETGDNNKPLSDGGPNGDQGFSFGSGGGGGGGGSGGGPSGFGTPGNDPGTELLPLSFSPDGGDGGKGCIGCDGPSFPSPAIPSIAAVPEPATWALFILGFGFIGAQLRRARDTRFQPALTRPRNRRLG